MTSRSAFGSSVSRCQTWSGGFPEARWSASCMSRSRFEPGKTMIAACIGGPREREGRGSLEIPRPSPSFKRSRCAGSARALPAAYARAAPPRGAAARARLAPSRRLPPRASRALPAAPPARLTRLGHGDRDRLPAALDLAATSATALELAALVLVHHPLHFPSLTR